MITATQRSLSIPTPKLYKESLFIIYIFGQCQSILRVISENWLSRNHQKMLDLSLHHREENKEVLYSKNTLD